MGFRTGDWRDMGTCQNDWLVTGPLAHTRYIPRCIGYVTEGGFRDIPRDFCPAEDIKAARQGVCNRPAFQGVCNRGLVARNATTPLFGTPPYVIGFSKMRGGIWGRVSMEFLINRRGLSTNHDLRIARGGTIMRLSKSQTF